MTNSREAMATALAVASERLGAPSRLEELKLSEDEREWVAVASVAQPTTRLFAAVRIDTDTGFLLGFDRLES